MWSFYREVGRTVEAAANSPTNLLSDAQQSSTSVSGTEEDPQSVISTLWNGIEKQHSELRKLHIFQKDHLHTDVAKASMLRQFAWLDDWAVRVDQSGYSLGLKKADTNALQRLHEASSSPLLESYSADAMLEYRGAVMLLLRVWDIHTRKAIRGAVDTLNQKRASSSSSLLIIPENTKDSSSDAKDTSVQAESSARSQKTFEGRSERNGGGKTEEQSGRGARGKPRHKRVSQLQKGRLAEDRGSGGQVRKP